MKKNYQALSGIDLKLFYAVTIYSYGVRLQGDNSGVTVRYLQKNYNVSNWSVMENGYLESSFEIDGIKLDITLT